MADRETVSDWGIHLSRYLQVLAALFPECFPQTMWPSWNTTTSMAGYPNILQPWWPTLRPTHRKRLILITCGLQGKQRRKTPWSYPKAHETKQPITLPNPRMTSFFPCRSLRGPSWHLKHPLCTWHTWKRRMPRRTKKWKARIPMVSTELLRSLWCILQGLWRMPKWRKSAVIIVAVWNTSICDCPLVRALRANTQLNHKEGMVPNKGA